MKSLTLTAKVFQYSSGEPFFRLTGEDLCVNESFEYNAEKRIIEALNLKLDDVITVTFTDTKHAR